METWKKIPGIPEYYEVSSRGNVRTYLPPYRPYGKRLTEPSQKYIWHDTSGYRKVTLAIPDKGRKNFLVAHLVLLAFEGPRPPDHGASHLDGNKDHDYQENLLWETAHENNDRELIRPIMSQVSRRYDPEKRKRVADKSRIRRKALRDKRRVRGLCTRCGHKLGAYKDVCDRCQEKRRNRIRKHKGLTPLQRSRIYAGLCVKCGSATNLYSRMCDACYAKNVLKRRTPKWKPGSVGHPPLAYRALLPEIYGPPPEKP